MSELTSLSYWESVQGGAKYPRLCLSYADRETARVFDPVMRQKYGGWVLEVGCGNSYWLPYFASRYNLDVAGLDYSAVRLARARRNLAAVSLNGDLRCFDIRRDSPIDWIGQFDIVYSCGVIEHFADATDVLRLCSLYLKADGLLVTTVPHLKGAWGDWDKRLAGFGELPYLRLDLEDLTRMHRKAGLTVVDASYFRLLDLGMLNWSRVPLGIVVNAGLLLLGILRRWEPRGLSPAWYADMIVVASL